MRRYALAGASGRALTMYARPIVERFARTARVVGVFDTNQARARYLAAACGDVPAYADFDTVLAEARPDAVIVTTVDRTHHEFIIRSLEAGCDVITEKPMTIDAARCRAILAAERRTGRRVTVAFNYRFASYMTRARELLRDGAIGRVTAVDFAWLLDTRHGADYFRRWHRRKENSGGLLVHKATHHFDLVNWWTDDEPSRVWASGARRVYGPTREERGERCSSCAHARTCEFHVDYRADPLLRALYFEAEHEDGYHRDGCVFDPEIDIEDTMAVAARYRSGMLLSYSLVAYSPYEGWRASLTGTEGRMELQEFQSALPARGAEPSIAVYDRRGGLARHHLPREEGAHGGGDARLQERLFGAGPHQDPLGHMAGSRAGALSMLIGAAANLAIASGEPVDIGGLLDPDTLASWGGAAR